MKIIRYILAKFVYKVPFQVTVWYNSAAMYSEKDWNKWDVIKCFDANGNYIDCPPIGGKVIYSIHGIDYVYKVIGFKNSNRNSDWLYSTDYINPIIQFIKK